MRPAIILLPLALAACDIHTTDDNGDNVHVSFSSGNVSAKVGDKDGRRGADRLSVNIPGFNANLSLPGLKLGGAMDLDGVKMAPGTAVTSMDVNGKDGPGTEDHGTVRIAFTNPDPAGKLLDYYRSALTQAGFTLDAGDAGGLKARKQDKSFAVQLAPAGNGSQGTITILGDDHAD
jgi:hypothetical protein